MIAAPTKPEASEGTELRSPVVEIRAIPISEKTQPMQPAPPDRRSHGRVVFWILCWLAAIFLIGVLVDYSEAFTDCIHTHKNRVEYHALHERSGIAGGAIASEQMRLHLFYICTGDFADRNNGAITAVATVIVGFFTFTLWYKTRGLRRLGEGQAADMRDLLKAARDNADAATGLRG